jgi:hypothetical protein
MGSSPNPSHHLKKSISQTIIVGRPCPTIGAALPVFLPSASAPALYMSPMPLPPPALPFPHLWWPAELGQTHGRRRLVRGALGHGGRPRGSREGRRVKREFCEPLAMGRLSSRRHLLPSLSPTWACARGTASSTSLTRGRTVGGAQPWWSAELPPSPASARPVS